MFKLRAVCPNLWHSTPLYGSNPSPSVTHIMLMSCHVKSIRDLVFKVFISN